MTLRPLEIAPTITAVAIALTAGTAAFLVFAAISRPPGLRAALTLAGVRTAEAEQLLTPRADQAETLYAPAALCRQPPTVAAEALRARLQSQASSAGLTVAHVDTTPGGRGQAVEGLAPITFALEVDGRYDAVIGMLGALSASQPQIFVDRLDLRSATSAVDLNLVGRVFCATSARL